MSEGLPLLFELCGGEVALGEDEAIRLVMALLRHFNFSVEGQDRGSEKDDAKDFHDVEY